jgi:hypothetical protein
MESNNYEWFISDTVEAMLPCFSDPKLALVMCVSLSWNDHGYDEDGNTKIREESQFKKDIWLVFNRPTNYTKVLVTDKKLNPLSLDKDPIQFKQYSDHDSCWRSDGFSWMFETFVEAWDYFDKHGIEGRKIDPMVHWSIFRGKPTYWLVDLKPVDREERWTTDYIVKFNKPLSLQKAVKYMPKEGE